MTQNSEIQSLVESFTSQLSLLVRRTALEQVHAALGGTDTMTTKSPRKVTVVRIGRAKRGGKRTSEQVEQMGATLLDHVKRNPGQRGEQIAAALKTDVGTMRLPMKALIAAKKVKTKGQRRGMTYYAS